MTEFIGAQSNRCLAARGGDGTQLVQQTCGAAGGQFAVESIGNGVVRLHPANAATSCLDLRNGSSANGTAIQQYTCQPSTSGTYPNQLFHIDPRSTGAGDPLVTISPNSTGKVFDITTASTADNATVQQWDYTGAANQQFTLHKVTSTPSSPDLVISTGKTVTSSTDYGTGYQAAYAVDDNPNTRWSSAFADPQWIQVDLGQNAKISRVRLNWEAAYATTYRIDTSTDGQTWTTIYSTTTGDGNIDDITNLNTTARYVRMYGTKRAISAGYSLWGMDIYGNVDVATPTPPATTPATDTVISTGKTATSSTDYTTGYRASYAVDDNPNTRWSSAFADPQWISIDLGQSASVSRVKLNWEAAYAKAYRIETSTDGQIWTVAYSTTTGDGNIDDITINPTTARYVRMYGTTRALSAGYSLWAFDVYGHTN